MTSDAFPPLVALRALEVSARLGSFARAAVELGVTPSAITQHIRTMEAWTGAPLFHRTGRQVFPTEHLIAVRQDLMSAFQELSAASGALRAACRREIGIETPVCPVTLQPSA